MLLFFCSFHCVLCGHHSDGVNETHFFTPCDPQAGAEEGETQCHVPGRMNLFFLGLLFSARRDIPAACWCLQDSPPWGGRTEQGVFKFHPLPTDHTAHPLERALYVSHLFWFLFFIWSIANRIKVWGSVVKNLPANARDLGLTTGAGSSPGEEMATLSGILVWRIPWREEPGRLQSMESQRVGHAWVSRQQQQTVKWTLEMGPWAVLIASSFESLHREIAAVEGLTSMASQAPGCGVPETLQGASRWSPGSDRTSDPGIPAMDSTGAGRRSSKTYMQLPQLQRYWQKGGLERT